MAKIDWPKKTTFVRQGLRSAVARVTGGEGDVIAKTDYFDIPFEISGKSGVWKVASRIMNWESDWLCRDLKEVVECIRSFTEMIHEDLTEWDVWRNSGAFVCISGSYKKWFVYAAKQPYGKAYYADAFNPDPTATKLRVSENASNPVTVITLIETEVDMQIKKVVKNV